MKKRNALLSLFVVIAMLASMLIVPASAASNYKEIKSITLGEGVTAKQYSVNGFSSATKDKTITASAIELTPGEYIPLVFANNAGWASRLHTHFEKAGSRYGYEVVAAMNGSFFSMANGYLNSMYISNGEIACAHSGLADALVAFMPDGKIETVKSCLSYTLMIDGVEVPSGLASINKKLDENNWGEKFYYFDSACGTKSDSAECAENGTELICKKTNNTKLVVGGTMTGEVVEVVKNSKGSKFNLDDKPVGDYFTLFVKNGSSFQHYADVEKGATIEITVDETVEESREIMQTASSVIANIGFLVKDGVDLTETTATIGTHSVKNYQRGWTNLGWKEDGSMILFVNDDKAENRLDQSDIAKTLLAMGYNNVIRFDGGGSSALYSADDGTGKPGYLSIPTATEGASRPVSDCILIVKKSSLENADYTEALKTTLDATAEALKDDVANVKLKAAYDKALALYGEGNPTSGEVAQAFALLSRVSSSTAALDEAIIAAGKINYADYSLSELAAIYDAYLYAKAVRSTKDAASSAIVKAADDLKAAISTERTNLAKGKTYTGAGNYGGYKGNLTDGVAESHDYDSTVWNGINKVPTQNAEVVLDLGKVHDIRGVATTVNNWDDGCGISSISKITIEFSTDGKNFTKVAEVTDKDRLGFQKKHTNVVIDEAIGKARYIKYSYFSDGSANRTFIMASEIEAYEGLPPVEKAGFVNDFNVSIMTGKASIFTPDFVTNFADSGCNIRWTQTAFLEWDEAKQGYKVVGVKTPDGKEVGTIKEGQLALSVHDAESSGDPDGSTFNRQYLTEKAVVGSYIEFHGIYVDEKTIIPGAYFKVVPASEFDSTYNGILGDINYDIPLKDSEDLGITGLTVKGDLISGITKGTTVDELAKHFSGQVTVDGATTDGLVGTGAKINYNGNTYTAVVKGDVNGDAKIDVKDYIKLRQHILKTVQLEGAYEAAGHLSTAEGSDLSIKDYIRIRLVILEVVEIN